jgi:uncharacterized protein (TIGR00255 family)
MRALRSMTGFGAGRHESRAASAPLAAVVEMRAVNHRYLQVKVRAPAELPDLEAALEALCKRHLDRGAVQISVRLDWASAASAPAIDWELVERYRALSGELAARLGMPNQLGLSDWLSLPGVMEAHPQALDTETASAVCLAAAEQALAALVAMRNREGLALKADLERHGAALAKLVDKIRRRSPQAVKAQFKALEQRLSSLLGERAKDLAPADLARELALLADKSDVAEELARLDSHLEQLTGFLHAKEPVGRALDFLVQELNREVNTIGSKCADAKIAAWVIAAKTNVERLREQVQNVE